MMAYFESFGCKVNQYETESLKESFYHKGYEITQNPKEADVIIINSCTVTSSGDSKSLYALRKRRRENPDAVIVFTGCLPQASPETAENIPEADIVTGTRERGNIVNLTEDFIKEKRRIVKIPEYGKEDEYEKNIRGNFGDKTRAFIKIQDGCNQFCSYCIIPYARGGCRSKPMEELREEAEALVKSGHREIVLVGINLAFYGKEYGLRLIDAVEQCCSIKDVERVRLGSLEPEMISDNDLLRLSKLKKFCPQFHLSLQSGCDRTLRSMNRKYSTEDYHKLCQKIRSFFPDCSFTTDIMVGFPEEKEEDFEESLEFVKKIGFSKIHVFQYSQRKGTPAAIRPQVPEEIKRKRAEIMKKTAAELQIDYLKGQVGKIVPVLFEQEGDPNFHRGYAPDYTLVKIPAKKCEKSLKRRIFYVKIEKSSNDCCIGTITESPAV